MRMKTQLLFLAMLLKSKLFSFNFKAHVLHRLSHYQFSGFDHYDLDREQRAKKSQDKKPKQPSKKPPTSEDIDLPDPILGDEPAGRGQHRCGNVPIPPIVCVDGKCPPGKMAFC